MYLRFEICPRLQPVIFFFDWIISGFSGPQVLLKYRDNSLIIYLPDNATTPNCAVMPIPKISLRWPACSHQEVKCRFFHELASLILFLISSQRRNLMNSLLNQFFSADKMIEYLSASSRLIALTFLRNSSVLSQLSLPPAIRLIGRVNFAFIFLIS